VLRSRAAGPAQTELGLVKGSVCFMAPEQARGLAAVDQRADLFSLGLLMYFALTGHTLYEGGSSYDLEAEAQRIARAVPLQATVDASAASASIA
jgi:serine/threonine protein kinase